jgi:hypothetical protein
MRMGHPTMPESQGMATCAGQAPRIASSSTVLAPGARGRKFPQGKPSDERETYQGAPRGRAAPEIAVAGDFGRIVAKCRCHSMQLSRAW